MDNWNKEELFDIGAWVATEDGLGQVLSNRNLHFEEFDRAHRDPLYKKGAFKRSIYICKILADFEGKIKKRFKIEMYTSINKLKQNEKKLINKIKSDFKDEYKKYLLYEPKEALTRQVFLEYNISVNQLDLVKKEVNKIYGRLPNNFTFNELKKEAHSSELPIKLSDFLKHDEKKDRKKCITIRLDSANYKTIGREALFNDVGVIVLSSFGK